VVTVELNAVLHNFTGGTGGSHPRLNLPVGIARSLPTKAIYLRRLAETGISICCRSSAMYSVVSVRANLEDACAGFRSHIREKFHLHAVLGYFYLIPSRGLWGFAIWICGLFGTTVEWRGQRLRIIAGGKILAP
jgi:hypothetical protein